MVQICFPEVLKAAAVNLDLADDDGLTIDREIHSLVNPLASPIIGAEKEVSYRNLVVVESIEQLQEFKKWIRYISVSLVIDIIVENARNALAIEVADLCESTAGRFNMLGKERYAEFIAHRESLPEERHREAVFAPSLTDIPSEAVYDKIFMAGEFLNLAISSYCLYIKDCLRTLKEGGRLILLDLRPFEGKLVCRSFIRSYYGSEELRINFLPTSRVERGFDPRFPKGLNRLGNISLKPSTTEWPFSKFKFATVFSGVRIVATDS